MLEHAVDHVHSLVVMQVNGHLQIQTGVLHHMTMGVGVLGSEDRSDFVDTLQGADGDLLGQLRTESDKGQEDMKGRTINI